MRRIYFEKVLFFLFVASWVNLPGIIYEKWSLDLLTNGHGKNLIPFLLPSLMLFFFYYYLRSEWSIRVSNPLHGLTNLIINKTSMEDRVLLVLIIYMIIINHSNAILNSSESNLRMIMPLISSHFFYWFYKKYSMVSNIKNLNDFFGKSVFFSIMLILVLQMLMFLGIVPGLVDEADADTQQKLTNFIQVNGSHIAQSSYTAIILLFLILFYKIKLPKYILLGGLLLILTALMVNQVRGALLAGAILLILYFVSKITLRNMFILGLMTLLAVMFYLSNIDSRIFTFDASASERIFLFEKTFEIFVENPIFGHGSYFAQNLRFGFSSKLIVHNYYLRFLVAYGIIGFIIFLCYLQPMFLRRFKYKYFVGLFVIFSIFTFDAYFYWAMLIIAVFHQNDVKGVIRERTKSESKIEPLGIPHQSG